MCTATALHAHANHIHSTTAQTSIIQTFTTTLTTPTYLPAHYDTRWRKHSTAQFNILSSIEFQHLLTISDDAIHHPGGHMGDSRHPHSTPQLECTRLTALLPQNA